MEEHNIIGEFYIDLAYENPSKWDEIVPVNLRELILKIESNSQSLSRGVNNADSDN